MAISDKDAMTIAIKLIRFQMEAEINVECQRLNQSFDPDKFNQAFFDLLKSDKGLDMVITLTESVKKDYA